MTIFEVMTDGQIYIHTFGKISKPWIFYFITSCYIVDDHQSSDKIEIAYIHTYIHSSIPLIDGRMG